jgi:hypothetical protein
MVSFTVVLVSYGRELDQKFLWWAFPCLVAISLASLLASSFVQKRGDGAKS